MLLPVEIGLNKQAAQSMADASGQLRVFDIL